MKRAEVLIWADKGKPLRIAVDGGRVICDQGITHAQSRAIGDLLPLLARLANDHVESGTFRFVGAVQRVIPCDDLDGK